MKDFNENLVGLYWPPERAYVDKRYENIGFPFEQVEVPTMEMKLDIPMMALVGYLKTWSATQRFIKENDYDPLEALIPELQEAWGKPEQDRTITWPLIIKAGYVK